MLYYKESFMIVLIPNFGSWLLQLISVAIHYITGLPPDSASLIAVRPTPTDTLKIFLEKTIIVLLL